MGSHYTVKNTYTHTYVSRRSISLPSDDKYSRTEVRLTRVERNRGCKVERLYLPLLNVRSHIKWEEF